MAKHWCKFMKEKYRYNMSTRLLFLFSLSMRDNSDMEKVLHSREAIHTMH